MTRLRRVRAHLLRARKLILSSRGPSGERMPSAVALRRIGQGAWSTRRPPTPGHHATVPKRSESLKLS